MVHGGVPRFAARSGEARPGWAGPGLSRAGAPMVHGGGYAICGVAGLGLSGAWFEHGGARASVPMALKGEYMRLFMRIIIDGIVLTAVFATVTVFSHDHVIGWVAAALVGAYGTICFATGIDKQNHVL